MKKVDLKKLALMGITGGVLLTSQSQAGVDQVESGSLDLSKLVAKNGCSGSGGCGGKGGNGNGNGNGNGVSNGNGGSNGNGNGGHSCGGNGGCGNKLRRSSKSQTPESYSYRRNEFLGRDIAMAETSEKQEMTEQDLWEQLNAEGRKTYQSLDSEGRALALQLANQGCKGQNDCKGLNSCATESNACAGEGGCQGQSPASFKDKNTAVKVAAKHMAEKRANLNNQ